MEITFSRVSDHEHAVEIARSDGSTDRVVLASKDFLRHDFAHLAFELELELGAGVWGSVARGGQLDGEGLDGSDIAQAERSAGRLQTLMRTGADVSAYEEMLAATTPDRANALGVSNEMPFTGMLIASEVMALADGPTEVHKTTVARQVLREHKAVDGLWPTAHLPALEAAARAKFADHLDLQAADY